MMSILDFGFAIAAAGKSLDQSMGDFLEKVLGNEKLRRSDLFIACHIQ